MRLLWFSLAANEEDPVLSFALAWLREVAAQVEGIDVVTMYRGPTSLPPNVRVYSVGKERGYTELRRGIEFYRILGRLLSEHDYDACFAHMMPLFAAMAAPYLKAKRVPIVLWYAHKSVTPVLRVAEKVVDRVVTASPESFRVPSRKVRVTGHGIDTNLFAPAQESRPGDMPFTIVSVGRIAPVKRLEILIEATRLLVERQGKADLHVRIVGGSQHGDPRYEEELHDRVHQYDLRSIVDFAGPIPFPRVAEEYRRADLVVNMSDTDSVDKAVLEAMSCEVPVLTANEAFSSVLGDLAASLVVPKDSPPELADAIQSLRDRPMEDRRQLGRRLRSIVVRDHDLARLARTLVSEVFIFET